MFDFDKPIGASVQRQPVISSFDSGNWPLHSRARSLCVLLFFGYGWLQARARHLGPQRAAPGRTMSVTSHQCDPNISEVSRQPMIFLLFCCAQCDPAHISAKDEDDTALC